MATEVTMPKLSDTMEEGKILRWLKQPGDPVKIGEIIAEVETDKANMELESYDDGVLSEIKVGENESAPVGSVIAILEAPGAKPAGAKPTAAKAAPSPADEEAGAEQEKAAETGATERPPVAKAAPAVQAGKPAARPAPAAPAKPAPRPAAPAAGDRKPLRPTVVVRDDEGGERVKASPLARKIAGERGIDLATVVGSGPGGRIVERDLEDAAPAAAPRAREAAAPAAAKAPAESPRGRVELSKIRRTTAKRMAEAKRDIPHFYASTDIAMDEAVRMKAQLAAAGAEFTGLTYTHFVVKAVGVALARVPEVNASYEGDAIVVHDQVNVGVATAVGDGLIVPVLHGVDAKSLADVVREARALVERARAGKFTGNDLSGATFTVSNLGMLPVTGFAAVVNPPQAAILAVGAVREVPVVRDKQVVPGHLMTVTLSSDHRLIDGMLAGRFLKELKLLLENPVALLV